MTNDGLLVVISGAAGTGKGTIVERLAADEGIRVSISATTRSPRGAEQDGREYHFLSREQFTELIGEDGFLEYAEYVGNFYGSPRKQAEDWMKQGKHVILEIEVQGCEQVKQKRPDCVSIFILPPSMEELERRLRKRGTETEEQIRARLARAKEELPLAESYDYQVVNDDLDACVEEIREIFRAEKEKRAR